MFNKEDKVKDGTMCESGYIRRRSGEDGSSYYTVEIYLPFLKKVLGSRIVESITKGARKLWKLKIK